MTYEPYLDLCFVAVQEERLFVVVEVVDVEPGDEEEIDHLVDDQEATVRTMAQQT